MADTAGGAAAAGGGEVWARLREAGPPLAYGLRLAASVCLALYVAFWLQLDQAGWAGTSAAITCQPILGASLRKGQYRFIGTAVGAVFLVVLTAALPQSRVGFLAALVVWSGLCSYISTLLKGPPSYAAMLAGYTAAIIAGGSINAPDDAFRLALDRASEITVGIACATVVLSLSDLGHTSALLAARMGRVMAGMRDGLRDSFLAAGVTPHDSRPARRGLIRAAAALDPDIDNAIGERATLRHRRPTLRAAVAGLFGAASGWRTVAA
ncbi:FUSC family protein, partial [Acidisphaera rubrifaciens]|uniref:FUSC family protein n=1 Tax=Acidisphaera rubrifaciens TaxID=50715 RepID=UPI0018F27698